jgi:Bacterial Ig domain
VIDSGKPSNVRITRQISLGTAVAVTTTGSLAYVATDSPRLVLVEMRSGGVLDQIAIPAMVQDLAVAGDYLYALTPDRLHVVSVADDSLSLITSVSSPYPAGPNRRLFVGGGLAYAVRGKGYNTFSLTNPAAPNFSITGVEADKGVWVAANVADDVQVRDVEFYLDGALIQTDGSFPFEFRFTTPPLTATKTNFTLRARAVDTGGNAASTPELAVPLLPDATPPRASQESSHRPGWKPPGCRCNLGLSGGRCAVLRRAGPQRLDSSMMPLTHSP